MTNDLKSERGSRKCSCEMSASVNEKLRIINVVFLPEILKKHQGELLVLDGKYVNMEEFVCTRIHGGIQPESI